MSAELKPFTISPENENEQGVLAVPVLCEKKLSQETLKVLSLLGETLSRIRVRLLASGEFEVVNRRLVRKNPRTSN